MTEVCVMGHAQSRLDELRELVRAGRYVQAVRSAKYLMADGALEPDEEVEAHHICSVALYKQEQVFPALEHAKLAEHLASERSLHDLAQKMRVNLVALLADVGDYQLAIEVGNKVLLDQRVPVAVRPQLAYIHFNLGRVYQALRDKRNMFEHYHTAVRLGAEHGIPAALMVQIRQQLAWRLYLDEQIAEADRHVEAVGALIQPDDVEGQREQLLLSCPAPWQRGAAS
jgi:tetratricopeptide (TPR) repeat protein